MSCFYIYVAIKITPVLFLSIFLMKMYIPPSRAFLRDYGAFPDFVGYLRNAWWQEN